MSGFCDTRIVAGVVSVCLALVASVCSAAEPTAAAGTPEGTIQAASVAAKKKDVNRYISFFSKDRHRSEVVAELSLMAVLVPVRQLAESEGPDSVKAVDARLADELALLKAIGKDWAWLAKTSKLDDDAETAEFERAVAKVANPGGLWARVLTKHPEMMLWWGSKIENVQVNGETATAKAYAEGNPNLDHQLRLKRVNGDWKIDVR